MQFVGGTIRVTNAPFDIAWNGSTWTGLGNMGKIEQTQETSAAEVQGLRFEIAGPLSSYVSLALGEVLQGAPCLVYVCFFDANHVVVDAALEWSGRIDTMTVQDSAENSIIQVTAESRLADWQRPRVRRHTNEDLQIDYAGDLFYEYIPTLVDAEVVWPAAAWFKK
jgi:hypothetical protein